MPVTARLSKRFYDVFGEEIATELVDWFNRVDETYRADLRELNELNFGRFDAKLEQRLAESDTSWESRLAALEIRWEHRLAALDAKWDRSVAELRVEIQRTRADLVKWIFAFWAPTALGVLGTGAGVVSLLLRR